MTCSIITQERLDRITEHVNEMTVGSLDNSESGESLEMSRLSPLNLGKKADKIEQNINFSSPEENSNVRLHPEKPLTSVEEEQSHYKPAIDVGCNGCDLLEANDPESASQVSGMNYQKVQEHNNGDNSVVLSSMQNKQVESSYHDLLEETESSSIIAGRLQRVESQESIGRYFIISVSETGVYHFSKMIIYLSRHIFVALDKVSTLKMMMEPSLVAATNIMLTLFQRYKLDAYYVNVIHLTCKIDLILHSFRLIITYYKFCTNTTIFLSPQGVLHYHFNL